MKNGRLVRPHCLSAPQERATANIGEHHRIRTAATEAIDDDATRRNIHNACTAQTVAAGNVHSLARIAAAAIEARRHWAIIIRRWRTMPARTDIDIHTLRRGKICRTRQRSHCDGNGNP